MNTKEMSFDDLTLITVPVKIGGKEYVLKEASGDAACRWRNMLLSSTKLGPDGKPVSIQGMADTEPYLVSLCLFEVGGDGKERAVPLTTIRAWPNRIQKDLFERLKEISCLEDRDTEDSLVEKMDRLKEQLQTMREEGDTLKKPPADGTAGSD